MPKSLIFIYFNQGHLGPSGPSGPSGAVQGPSGAVGAIRPPTGDERVEQMRVERQLPAIFRIVSTMTQMETDCHLLVFSVNVFTHCPFYLINLYYFGFEWRCFFTMCSLKLLLLPLFRQWRTVFFFKVSQPLKINKRQSIYIQK